MRHKVSLLQQVLFTTLGPIKINNVIIPCGMRDVNGNLIGLWGYFKFCKKGVSVPTLLSFLFLAE